MSTEELQLVQELRAAQVLLDVQAPLLNPVDGAILLTCGDGDQFADIFRFKSQVIADAGCPTRIHPLTPLGGALRILPDSPVNQDTPTYPDNILFDLITTRKVKGINTVALYVHWPCGMAKASGMTLLQVLISAFQAKRIIKDRMPGINACVFVHLDTGGKKNTYVIRRESWEGYIDTMPSMQRLRHLFPDRVSTVVPPAYA